MNNKVEPATRLQINAEHIELYKILKIEGLVSSGAIAKREIASGLVKVNGLTEIRKRKKILPGDIVEYMSQEISIS